MTAKEYILETLTQKYAIKLQIYDLALQKFTLLKSVLQAIVQEYNETLSSVNEALLMSYRDKGDFEAELKVGGELLIFNLHTNIFQLDPENELWKSPYLEQEEMNGLCGVISIYNFISDSIKYNRADDLGYLIGRLFVNRDEHYFVEGKHQLGFLYNKFEDSNLGENELHDVLESAILFALNFDLLVPDYDEVSVISVAKMQENINNSLVRTGKRIGFTFNQDVDS